jgi:MSHA biogenesis protein MshN
VSLINKVLNDLDQRNPTASRGNGSAVVAPPRFAWLRWVGLVLLVILVGVLAWWLLQSDSAPNEPTEPAVAEESVADKKAPVREESAVGEKPSAEKEPSADKEPSAGEQPAAEKEPTPQPVAKKQPETPAKQPATTEEKPRGSFTKQSVELSNVELAERAWQKAKQAQQQGLFSDAAEHYQAALNAQPQQHDIRKEWAALEFGRGRATQALAVLREGLAQYPNAHSLRLLAASMLEKQAQPSLALKLLQQATPDASQLPQYYQLHASLAQQQGQITAMRDSYQALVDAQPDNGRWHLGLALALREQQPKQALAAFEQAAIRIEHTPTLNFIAEQIKLIRNQHATSTP